MTTISGSGVTALLLNHLLYNLKFSDNQTYVKVLTRLQILEPLEVCITFFIHA